MLVACYNPPMGNLQVKNVPEDLHGQLARHAADHGETMSQVVLRAVRRELGREAFLAQLRARKSAELGNSAASLLHAERKHAR